MQDLRTELEAIARGALCLVGLGNVARGDDGLGVRLAEAVQARATGAVDEEGSTPYRVVIAGTTPERSLTRLAEQGVRRVLLLDAVDFGGRAGSLVLLNAAEIQARFPQISTHQMSLGLWARWLEADGRVEVWLLGVQPESLHAGNRLSPQVEATVTALADLLVLSRREDQRTRRAGDGAPDPPRLAETGDPCLC